MSIEPAIHMGPHTKLREALETESGRTALDGAFASLTEDGVPMDALLEMPASVALSVAGISARERAARLKELARGTRPRRPHGASIRPDDRYDRKEAPAARLRLPETSTARTTVEIIIDGPSHGNPFVDVELRADIVHESGISISVGGFYDGDGAYIVRFLPELPGSWSLRTEASAHSLDDLTGVIEVQDGAACGAVRVADRHGFAYANGDTFAPFGTTVYAWTHQRLPLQEETLSILAAAPFNKVRLCVFPKAYEHNSDDPELFPFEASDGFDHTRFVPAFFRNLERRVRDLDALGIQADLILFHPYDRWGFSDLGPAVDERYLRYLVRRLSAFPNVWWSLANEYDLVTSKDDPEWNRLAGIVQEEDPVGHLLSIHNGLYPFDYTAGWTTHASLQRCDSIRSTEMAPELLERWEKPVIFDEMGYEGDLEAEWGNVPAVEVVRQFWEAMVAGAYVTHGETFWREDGVIFWARGGKLRGESPARIAFLARIVADSPSGRLDSLRTGLLGRAGGVAGQYEVTYFGLAQPRVSTVVVPAGRRAEIDVIDTWAMTVETVPGTHEGRRLIELPARPYVAVRMRVVG